MATCKDCIYWESCRRMLEAFNPEFKGKKLTFKSTCVIFKNKTEFAEVKHGKWIPVQYTYFGLKRYECSECMDDEYWQKRYVEHKEKYCPNCGARMDGD